MSDIIIEHISKSSGSRYMINLTKLSCSCPDWRNRQAKVKGLCKHLRAELEKVNGTQLDYTSVIKENDDAVLFVEKYTEEVLDTLKRQGIVYEERGRLKLI